jgi:hypothetical protein
MTDALELDRYPEAQSLLAAGTDRETLQALCERIAQGARTQAADDIQVAVDAWRNEPRA